MVTAINSPYEAGVQVKLLKSISKFYDEVRKLLPELPETVQIYFSNDFLYDKTGVGGFAYDHDIITVSFDETFADKALQQHELRGIIFHEAYHLAHGFYNQKPAESPLHISVYEGAAGVFQRDVAGIAWVGAFDDEAAMNNWYEKVKLLKFDDNYDWYKWKVYDEESGQDAILYTLGTYIIDRAIRLGKTTIFDLRHKKPTEILRLAEMH